MTGALALLALLVIASRASAGAISEAEAPAIVHKHCVTCHAAKSTHPAFAEAPNGVVLETIADLKKYAQRVYMQTVQ